MRYLFYIFSSVLGSVALFHRKSHPDYKDFKHDIFADLYHLDDQSHTDEIQATLHRLRNRMYRRELQAMIDNLTIGAGAHARRHTLDEFQPSNSFTPAPSRAQIKAKRFRMYHENVEYF